jgi:hypothetical protein
MEKPAPNFKLLLLSAILFLVGVGNLVYIVISSASSFNKEMVRIEMPGLATVQLPESGLQQVFHEWKNSSERQIGNLTLAVTDQVGATRVGTFLQGGRKIRRSLASLPHPRRNTAASDC